MADETRTIAWQLVVETRGIEQNTAKASSSLGELSRGFKFLQGAIAGIAAGVVARTFQDLSDTLTRVQNDIRKVTSSTEEFDATQRALIRSAMSTYSSLETTAANYRALRTSLEGYGVSAKQVIGITDTVTKAVKLAGGSAEDAQGLIRKLAFAFETGTVSSKELNAMIREAPDLFKAMGDSADNPIPKLRELAAKGKLTAQELLDGLGGAADKINEQFANRIPSIAESFTQLKTALVATFAEFDKATGISALLSKAILALADDIADLPNQLKRIAINVQEMFELAVLDVTTFFSKALNSVREWLAKIGAFFASAIPDWKWLGQGVADAKQKYQDMAKIAADSNKSIAASAEISRAAIVEKFAKQRAAIGETNDGILELTVSATRFPPAQSQAGVDAYTKALEGLRTEAAKLRDQQTALSIEIVKGAQASKEYTIAAEARRRVEGLIAGIEGIKPEQIAALQGLAAANAAAAIETERYGNAWNLVKTAMDEGRTAQEKAADKLKETEAGFKLLSDAGALSAEQIRRTGERLKQLREEADPTARALKQIQQWTQQAADQTEKYAISNQALAISLRDGDAAARAYTNTALAELAVRQKIQEAIDKKEPLSQAEIDAYRKAQFAIADAKTANEDYAASHRLVTDALNFGISSQEQMRQQIEATRAAIAAGLVPPEQVAAVKVGLEKMAAAVDPFKATFVDAIKSMGQSIVDFAIDGTQSFSEFAANVIKDIGRMIAQMLMLQAIKAAFGGVGGMLFAKGAAFDRGNVIPFQHGGLVSGPTTFPLAAGRRGLMGEAGPEAVMPLARLPGGDLGVKAEPAPLNLEVINNTGVNATARIQREADRTQLILEAAELGATMAQSRFTNSVSSGYGTSATTMQRTYGLTRRKA